MAKKKAKKSGDAPLIVGSKVKAYIKGSGAKSSSDVLECLDAKVRCVLDAAIKRAQANKRTTLRGHDL